MAQLRKTPGYKVVQKGVRNLTTNVTIKFDKTLTVHASASDCLDFVGTALREWFREAHSSGQRYDKGMLPVDGSGWVGYDTGLLATRWRSAVSGTARNARLAVYLSFPDLARRARISRLAKQGIRLMGLDGKALDVYTKAFATYMADAVTVE